MNTIGNINLITRGIDDIFLDNGDCVYNINNINQSRGFLSYYSNNKFNFIDCHVDEVSDNANTEYYFVFSTQNIFYSELCKLFLDDTKSKQLSNLFLNKNLKILFINVHEIEDIEDITNFLNILKKIKINLNQIFLINNDSNLDKYNKQLNWDITTYKTNHLAFTGVRTVIDKHSYFIDNKGGKFFLNLNNHPKPHRFALVSLLHKFNLLEDVNFSLLRNRYNEDDEYCNLFGDDFYNNIKQSLNYIDSIIPKNSDFEPGRDDFCIDGNYVDVSNYVTNFDYLNSYINITTESNYFSKSVHISEKSFKLFYFYQLPLFLASQYHVKFLKDTYGFDMFDDIIDHSYDSESNNTIRILKVFDEIKRLDSQKETIKKMYKSLQNRLENNKKIIYDLSTTNDDYNIFLDIYNKQL